MSTVATSAVASHTFLGTIGTTCTTCGNGSSAGKAANTARGIIRPARPVDTGWREDVGG